MFLMVNVVLQVVKEIKLNSISNFVDNVFVVITQSVSDL